MNGDNCNGLRSRKTNMKNLAAVLLSHLKLLSSEFATREIAVQFLTSGEILLSSTREQTNDYTTQDSLKGNLITPSLFYLETLNSFLQTACRNDAIFSFKDKNIVRHIDSHMPCILLISIFSLPSLFLL